ncbi:gustatory receptor-like 36a [Drosophila kikkawai]|uniref:Gustatory receptor-like 36a n=1 Tax=Drosophila kikkawai TaxID=30033 RepID=A0A6P4ISB7_DROKI|nr:uncharacterized protein CG31750-like [Drosophila kikkawai]
MPEEKYGSTRRASCGKWRSRLLRWSVLGIGWSTYIVYRSFVVGQIKYDALTGKMIIRPRNMWIKRIALVLKISAMCVDNFGLVYLTIACFPLLFISSGDLNHPKRLFEDLVEAVIFQIAFWNIGRLYYWLRSLSWNRSLVLSVNEVICVMSLIEETFGPLPIDGPVLLIIFVVQFDLTVLQIAEYLYGKMFVLALHTILLALFYNAYIAYQLLLLSWMATFNRFSKGYHQKGTPTWQERQQLQHLFCLYSRVSNGHQNIMVLWLPVATMLFSNIVVLVAHWSIVIYCVLFIDSMNAVEKWQDFLREQLGGSLTPLLRILLIGLCNDRLAKLERFLSLQLLFIDLRYSGCPEVRKGKDLEQTCFDIQLRAQPIRNQIMSMQHVCGCPFVLEFFFCTFLNALNCVQYAVANGINIKNF